MIQFDKIFLSFGDQIVFDHISYSIDPHKKIGLVGRNGAGKTTLLNVIAGRQLLDDGDIRIPKDFRLAFMPQEVVLTSEKNLIDETISTNVELTPYLDDFIALEAKIQSGEPESKDWQAYAHLHHVLHELDFENKKAQAKQMLNNLGFKQEQLDKSVNELSVGWKMRVILAKLLLQKADFYLFDEPTNHLDLIAKDWFVEFLKSAPFGFMLVSHDKYFLNNVCQEICDLALGNLNCYQGNYDSYLVAKEQSTALREKKYAEQQKYIKKQTATIERFRAKATKASMAQSMIKALEKIELIELESEQKSVRVSLPKTQPTGKIVLDVNKISFAFGQNFIFQHATFQIPRGHKVALVAANGMGKSTLLNVIMGNYKPTTGSITFGYHVTPAFFEQDQNKSLNAENTIFDEIEAICESADDRARVRGLLGSFLFSGDDVYKKIKVLSGGEKNRVAMVKILLAHANFLILDEPTNHLDIVSKDILLDALTQFDGTILFVSHDRSFLNSLATDILELTPTRVYHYSGNYDEYLYHKQQLSLAESEDKKIASKANTQIESTKKSSKELNAHRRQLQQLEGVITKLEHQITNVTDQFGHLTYGSLEWQDAQKKLATLQQTLKDRSHDWEQLMSKLDT